MFIKKNLDNRWDSDERFGVYLFRKLKLKRNIQILKVKLKEKKNFFFKDDLINCVNNCYYCIYIIFYWIFYMIFCIDI